MSQIVDKIKKLLAIAQNDGSSDAEIENAMAIAQREMARYHISEEDLKESNDTSESNYQFQNGRSWVGGRIYRWECTLSQFVSKFVGVNCYISDCKQRVRRQGIIQTDKNGRAVIGKYVAFYGVSEDVAIATELYDELRVLIASMAQARWGGVYKGEGGMYAEGFVSGLQSKLKKVKALPASTGLIVQSQQLIARKKELSSEWLKSTGVQLHSRRTSNGANGSTEAFNEGKTDGRKADVNKTRHKKLY